MRDLARDRIRSRRRTGSGDGPTDTATGGELGLSAGSDEAIWSAWGDLSGSYLKDNAGGANSYQGWTQNYVVGLDRSVADSWVVGVSSGYVKSDFGVPSLNNGSRHNGGAFIGPYVSYIIGEHYSVDGSLNYANIQNDVVTLGTPNNIRHFGSARWTYALNGNYFRDIGNFSFTGFAGWTYSYEHQRGHSDNQNGQFTTAGIHYGAWKIGAELAYPIGDWEPYIPVTFDHQVTDITDGTGRSGILIGLGVRYHLGDAVKLGLLLDSVQDKRHQREDTIGANLRVNF
jgi:uncharacterized protein with beta-barrel porin domain